MRRVHPSARRLARPMLLAVLLSALLLGLTPPPGAARAAEAEMTFLEPYPRGEVMLLQPEIGWPVRVVGATVRHAVLELRGPGRDGRVRLAYETEKGYVYRPEQPLAPGRYEALIRLDFAGPYRPVERQWTFSVHPDGVLPSALLSEASIPPVSAALAAANDYRERLGLEPFRVHPSLMWSAKEHAAYLAANGLLSHFQEPGKARYVGATVEERARRAGYFFGVAEDISQQPEPDPVLAMDGLFDAPYHRIPFLLPQARDWGYGQEDVFHVMNVGLLPMADVRIVHAPGDGESGVPLQWNGREVPDPLRVHDGAGYPVGYPIVLGAFGDDIERVRLLSARLSDEGGTELPLYVNTPDNDEELQREIILIPVHPLKPATAYSVSVDWVLVERSGRERVQHTAWTFRTERRVGEGKQQLHQRPAASEGEERPGDASDGPPTAEGHGGESLTQVTFWTNAPWMQSWIGSFSLPFAVSYDRLAPGLRWLHGRFGITWDEEERRLRWQVAGFELEWLFD